MARETGGACYEVTKTETIEKVYSRIEDALRNQYNIGYTPQAPVAGGKYRKIKLATKNSRLIVNTREGYYAN
jgi:VWFA-related protein